MFDQVGDQVDQAEDQVGQGQGQELDNRIYLIGASQTVIVSDGVLGHVGNKQTLVCPTTGVNRSKNKVIVKQVHLQFPVDPLLVLLDWWVDRSQEP